MIKVEYAIFVTEYTKILLGHPCHQTSNLVTFDYGGCIKRIVFGDNIKNVSKLKDTMHQHVCNTPSDILRATVKNTAMRFNLLLENDGCTQGSIKPN